MYTNNAKLLRQTITQNFIKFRIWHNIKLYFTNILLKIINTRKKLQENWMVSMFLNEFPQVFNNMNVKKTVNDKYFFYSKPGLLNVLSYLIFSLLPISSTNIQSLRIFFKIFHFKTQR